MMSQTRKPGGPRRLRPVTLERLRELLEAYGAAAQRWPDTEREAAQRCIEQSAAARALWDEAADVDRLLDAVPAEAPSPALAARVLADAPRRRSARGWRGALAAAVPLAVAAAATLWLVIRHEPGRQIAKAPALAIGEYSSPTDVLLESYGIDVYANVPSIGCSDSVLGCPKVDAVVEPYSHRQSLGRSLA
jgi:hypothetical protein